MTALGVGSRPTARRKISRRSCTIASKQPSLIQRWVCWYTNSHGGRLVGSIRHDAPARTIHRSPLKTSRNSYFRCGASSRTRARYGATNAHSSSLTSLGYGFRAVRVVSIPKLYGIHRTEFLRHRHEITVSGYALLHKESERLLMRLLFRGES